MAGICFTEVPYKFSLVFGSPPPGTTCTSKKGKGRPRKIDARLGEILNLLIDQKLSIRKIASIMNVSHMTVYRLLERSDAEFVI